MFSLVGVNDKYLGQIIVALPKPPSEGAGGWGRFHLIRLRCLLTGKRLSKCAEPGCPRPPKREWSGLVTGVFCTFQASPEQSRVRFERLMARDHPISTPTSGVRPLDLSSASGIPRAR